MITSITGATFAASANIGQSISMLYDAAAATHNGVVAMKASLVDVLRASLEDVLRAATDLELDATIASGHDCKNLLSRATFVPNMQFYNITRSDAERLAWTLQNLRTNFSAQMSSRLVLVLNTRRSKYLLSDEPPFGREVEDIFPTASEEISEAAKCLALQRPTAVVFHLMRAMELAVQRMARSLGRDDPDQKVWGIILADIHAEIQKMPKGATRDAWSASHTHLYHVKQAWRNDTMHPKTTYTEAQAETVFEAVKSFMSHLARLVSEAERP